MTLALSQITLNEADVEANLKQLETWDSDFETLMVRLAPRFKRAELRERVKEYVQGLLSSAERKNSWQIAEQLGKSTPSAILIMKIQLEFGGMSNSRPSSMKVSK